MQLRSFASCIATRMDQEALHSGYIKLELLWGVSPHAAAGFLPSSFGLDASRLRWVPFLHHFAGKVPLGGTYNNP